MTLTMFDTAGDGSAIPANPQAVAGYLDGGNYDELVARYPHAHHLGIATHPQIDGDCLDVEGGDARASDAVAWVKRMQAEKRFRPCVYSSMENGMPEVVAALKVLPRASYRLWVASWSPNAAPKSVPSCDGVACDGVQWLPVPFRYDASLLNDDFFAPPAPAPRPTLTKAQKTQCADIREDLVGIGRQPGELTQPEYDQLVLAHARIAAILGVK